MIHAEFRSNIKMPKIDFSDWLLESAEKIVIPDIQAGIHGRKAIDGGSLPSNKSATVKAKGHDKPLIGKERELIRAFKFKTVGTNKVKIYINEKRDKIAGYLQDEGIKTKEGRKYYKFFGLSKDAVNNIERFLSDKIRISIKNV